MSKNRNTPKSIAIVLLIAACFCILNIDMSIRQGVNGRYRRIHMPLYVKSAQFIGRHHEYVRIAKEITAQSKTAEEKALALFNWTHDNIREVPAGMPVVDDHVLNIIIRGYGTADQSQDVFTTLCMYAALPAFWQKVYNGPHTVWYPISFVKLNGKWRVFDSYYGKYFRTASGEIASVDDIINDSSIIDKAGVDSIIYMGVPYKEFFHQLNVVEFNKTLRPEKQIPLRRAIFEIKKLFKIEKENEEDASEVKQ